MGWTAKFIPPVSEKRLPTAATEIIEQAILGEWVLWFSHVTFVTVAVLWTIPLLGGSSGLPSRHRPVRCRRFKLFRSASA